MSTRVILNVFKEYFCIRWSGFYRVCLAEELLKDGHDVVVVDNLRQHIH
ncbi:MAG: hypothetical protein ACE5J5_06920 [Candidatus Hydrothermarchaeales archaeon]